MQKKRSRRSVVRTGVAIAGGVGLGAVYSPPTLTTVAVYETAYASGGNSQGQNGNGQGQNGTTQK